MAWRQGHRPRKANAKRRRTTLAGRRPDVDLGSPELIARRARVANGATVPVELVDVVGILAANELIVDEELVTLRVVAAWLAQIRRGLGLSGHQASVNGLWASLLSGARGGAMPDPFGGDRALFRLGELFQHFAGIDQLEVLRLIIKIAAGEAHPENAFELAPLRYGAQILVQLQRRGRSRSRPSA